jgi:uracil-DNA glycosylase
VQKHRGLFFPLKEGFHATVTVHPSALLRIPEREERRAQFAAFVEDLRRASAFARRAEAEAPAE